MFGIRGFGNSEYGTPAFNTGERAGETGLPRWRTNVKDKSLEVDRGRRLNGEITFVYLYVGMRGVDGVADGGVGGNQVVSCITFDGSNNAFRDQSLIILV